MIEDQKSKFAHIQFREINHSELGRQKNRV